MVQFTANETGTARQTWRSGVNSSTNAAAFAIAAVQHLLPATNLASVALDQRAGVELVGESGAGADDAGPRRR